MKSLKLIVCVATLACAGSLSVSAMAADGQWAKEHPRRAEVNKRLAHQERRISEEVREGEMTKDEAHALRKQDHQIREEERDMAAQHGGHITRQEQRALNRQENAVSKQIGK